MNHVEDILMRAIQMHLKKRQDYTTKPDENPFENFERANVIIEWFPDDFKSFASHIGTKLARLGALLSTGREPNNESLDDSFLDLVTYCALSYGYYKEKQPKIDNWLENRKATERKTNWSVTCKTCKLPIAPNSIIHLDDQYFAHHGYCKV